MENSRRTVEAVTKENLCISCGICSAVCPKDCIEYQLGEDGLYKPVIHEKDCIACGECFKVCPGKGYDYPQYYRKQQIQEPDDYFVGNIECALRVIAKDEETLLNSSSGGFVTTAVKHLLKCGSYESAFLVDSDNFDHWVQTSRFTAEDDLQKTAKSRYIPVSQKNTVEYMKKHPDEKMILVGTGCFVRAVLNIIEKYHLKRENYLIIGLFCNYTLTYNVYDYFRQHSGLGESADGMYFRKKELHQGAYKDRVVVKSKDGTEISMPRQDRRDVVEMFTAESCLYCLDKLNQFADISVGDDYTKEGVKSKAGCSSVLVRTQAGQLAWESVAELFDYNQVEVEDIIASQGIGERKRRVKYMALKNSSVLINPYGEEQVSAEDKKSYKEKLRKQQIGRQSDYKKVRAEVEKSYKKRNGRIGRIKFWISNKKDGLVRRIKQFGGREKR